MGERTLMSIRMTDQERELLDQLVELIKWRDEQDRMGWRKQNRTSALVDAVRWAHGHLTSLKRTEEEKAAKASKSKATR